MKIVLRPEDALLPVEEGLAKMKAWQDQERDYHGKGDIVLSLEDKNLPPQELQAKLKEWRKQELEFEKQMPRESPPRRSANPPQPKVNSDGG